MKVALFIPCYIDAFFPEVGIATLELLERLGCEVDYPLDQTCCGQPMANSGCHDDARGTEALFAQNFAGYDHIVTPSGSCAHHVRDQMTAIEQTPAVQAVRRNTRELVEFLHDVLEVREFPWAEFPHKVGLHIGCATLRGLREAKASEIDEPAFNKPARPAVRGQGNRVRAAAAARRMLRLRRHLLGLRGAGVGEDGLRQGRATTTRRAPSTSSRPTCRASCTSRAAPPRRPAAEVHPHRPGAERSARMRPSHGRDAAGSITRRRPRSSSRPRTTPTSTTSACGTCARSATPKARRCRNGRSCARSPRRSRNTR